MAVSPKFVYNKLSLSEKSNFEALNFLKTYLINFDILVSNQRTFYAKFNGSRKNRNLDFCPFF